MTTRDVAVVEAVYAAFAAQDLEALLGLSDPEIVITQDESIPWGGRYVGHEGVTNFALGLIGTSDSTVSVEALFEADGKVIQIGRSSGKVRANGKHFDIPEVHTWTVRDGKVVEAHFAVDTPAMLEALDL